MSNHSTVKAVRATVKFCDGIEVDGYMLPDGEFRVGIKSASLAVGFGKDWVARLTGENLKTLQDMGFVGSQQVLSLDSIKGGGTSAKTISLTDFKKLVLFATSKGKVKAIALLSALLEVGLEDWFRLSFGLNQLTLEEKRAKFYNSYVETVDWLEEDRQEAYAILDQQRMLYPELFDEYGNIVEDIEFDPFIPEDHTDEGDWI